LRIATLVRVLLLLAVAAGIAAAIAFRGEVQPLAIKAQLADYRYAELIYIGATIVASFIFVPRTLLAVAGGLLFGLVWGLVWTMIASTIGAVLGFLLARYVNNGLVDAATLPRLAPVLNAAERGGWRIVALIRIPPLPHTAVNYALGLTRLSLRSYAIGSFFGMLPSTIAAVEVGVAGGSAMSGQNWLVPATIALVFLGATSLVARLPAMRRWLGLEAVGQGGSGGG
jgi:uncharacterized membrane protein YdjX (TVP38/TMEM64 family)